MSGNTERLNAALAGRYKIEKQLGQGGMATVYLAQDLKHDRKVAVKVLKPELAAVLGAERFVVEIKTTASLQHPHILPLFDSGTADGFLYYVMPYIEGETLRDKLRRETQFGIDEAVRIATQVADALDYAHRHGVIHRDIKPENILLHDGRPMVADFGIALAVSAAAGGRMTETGLSLGTPHYMSPEQATADKDITARSDIYSLASVLYEMLAGQPPHMGNSAQMIIMRIIAEPVEAVTKFRKSVPPNVTAAVAQALEKLPADRFESAKSFAEALANPDFISRMGASAAGGRSSPAARAAVVRWAWLGWGVGAIGLAVAAWTLRSADARAGQRSTPSYLNIALPDSAPLAFVGPGTLGLGRRALALSPDGRTLVYAARAPGSDRIYRRDLSGFSVVPIDGTDGAYFPFVSPDGAWVAYFVGAELRKTRMAGGPAVTLVTVAEPSGADWAQSGRILVSGREGWLLGWVPESGGRIQEIPNPQAVSRSQPRILPGGRHALVRAWSPHVTEAILGVVDLESGRTEALTAAGPVVVDSVDPAAVLHGEQPEYLPFGHLLYSTPAGLLVVAFDPVTHRIGDRPVEVLSGVRREANGTQYVVGTDGTLLYAAGGDANIGELVWVARDGAVENLGFAPQRYGTFALSPDGRRVGAIVQSTSGTPELWVYDVARKTESKMLTRGEPVIPRWWPDGRRLMFSEIPRRAPYKSVSVRQAVETAGERDTLGVGWEINDIAPDSLRAAGTMGWGSGAWVFPLGKGGQPIALDSFATAWGPAFSRDGRWLAYTSNESGQYEIYVVDASRRGQRQKVSHAGGEEPLWSPRGGELIYRWGQAWFAVAAPGAGSTTFGRAHQIFSGQYVNVPERSHDITPDGRRHLVILGPREQTTTRLNVITNWTAEIARKVPR